MERRPDTQCATGQLRVNDHHRRQSIRAAGIDAGLLVDGCEETGERAVERPAMELGPHPGPVAEVGRQVPPLVLGVSDVQQGIDDFA